VGSGGARRRNGRLHCGVTGGFVTSGLVGGYVGLTCGHEDRVGCGGMGWGSLVSGSRQVQGGSLQ